ncbi:DUF6221 family protein [Thermomonospora cellulosilytica]|uniref:Uncharacterized protein n=1 Tax=Thermomonospora cellulosilytica TaxID=1411118 RepID=A0A7W3N1R0_9ACTN|nr:DUF6221 family protein [Thermomonospora cellulosilytica]MBA9005948.1 hypothetical protein [Thermomonospora cellulosilytica]
MDDVRRRLAQAARVWLRADEDAARQVTTHGVWQAPMPAVPLAGEEPEMVAVYGKDWPWLEAARCISPGDARHIARHHPARVLADVEALRQVVALCETETAETDGLPLAMRILELLARDNTARQEQPVR